MNKIRVHNPCNEHTRYFRYYNYFWDKFTDFLKTKFDVEENRYFENAHFERFKVELQKGTSDEFLMMECEYVIENLDNGEFVIMSVADDLGYVTMSERDNPYLKKCLISQFNPKKIEVHTNENYFKYSSWTYFQCLMTNLEEYREKRNSTPNKIDKMYFRGDQRGRKILEHLDSNLLDNPERTNSEQYFDEVINYSIGLSVGGVGEICYRDIEYMALGIPFIRFEYQNQLNPPLIPNYHYISVPFDETLPTINNIKLDRLGKQEQSKQIEGRFNEVINDKEFLNFISENARKYYEDYLTIDKLIINTYNLLGIEDWITSSSILPSNIVEKTSNDLYPSPKTIFLDIDKIPINEYSDKIINWGNEGHNLILFSGKKESHRNKIENELSSKGISYDRLILGLGYGDKILINENSI